MQPEDESSLGVLLEEGLRGKKIEFVETCLCLQTGLGPDAPNPCPAEFGELPGSLRKLSQRLLCMTSRAFAQGLCRSRPRREDRVEGGVSLLSSPPRTIVLS